MGRGPQARAIDVHRIQDGVLDHNLEVTVVLVEFADADFQVFIELGSVEGLGHDGDSKSHKGTQLGRELLHRPDDLAVGETRDCPGR